MEELEKLLKEQLSVLNSVAATLNKLSDGQETLQRSLDTLQAPGKASGSDDEEEDDEEDEEEDDDKKSIADRMEELEAGFTSMKEEFDGIVKTLHVLVEKATGESINLDDESTED